MSYRVPFTLTNPFKTSVWQSQRLSYRSQKSVWHLYTLSYHALHLPHHIHTLRRVYTHAHHSIFQVFSIKTCWLLDFKHHFACWLRFYQDYKPLLCQFFTKIELSSTESTGFAEFERFGTILDRVSHWEVVYCLRNSVLKIDCWWINSIFFETLSLDFEF